MQTKDLHVEKAGRQKETTFSKATGLVVATQLFNIAFDIAHYQYLLRKDRRTTGLFRVIAAFSSIGGVLGSDLSLNSLLAVIRLYLHTERGTLVCNNCIHTLKYKEKCGIKNLPSLSVVYGSSVNARQC